MYDSTPDPRDAADEAANALCGLAILVGDADGSLPARYLASLLLLIHDRLEPATRALQDYVPRD